jgi:hypothetical protein
VYVRCGDTGIGLSTGGDFTIVGSGSAGTRGIDPGATTPEVLAADAARGGAGGEDVETGTGADATGGGATGGDVTGGDVTGDSVTGDGVTGDGVTGGAAAPSTTRSWSPCRSR